ncbi:MAG: hypothetical protein ACHQNV_03845 [Vicinamibacteria bacterium]
MQRPLVSLVCGLSLAAAACTKPEPKLTRDQVLTSLQQEAAHMKADGENMPDVGVKATWTIVAVDVQEQAGNDAKPFKGSVRFKIESSAHALGGQAPQNFEKKFDYVYDAAQKKWLFGQ